jgi:hypothetical protein
MKIVSGLALVVALGLVGCSSPPQNEPKEQPMTAEEQAKAQADAEAAAKADEDEGAVQAAAPTHQGHGGYVNCKHQMGVKQCTCGTPKKRPHRYHVVMLHLHGDCKKGDGGLGGSYEKWVN